MKTYDYIIIGAGMAGLSMASLLANDGHTALILEHHQTSGGCAGYYRRKNCIFDVGATTLSALSLGMPLSNFFSRLGLKPNVLHLKEPMSIHLPGNITLTRHANNQLWIKELEEKFPLVNHRDFWTKLNLLAQKIWPLLNELTFFPPSSFSDALKFLRPKILANADLAPLLFRPLLGIMPKDYQSGSLRQLIDQQLMISTQTTANDVPILMGALGLTYPSDMYYPFGGMKALSDLLENFIVQHKGEFLFKKTVQRISDHNEVICHDGTSYKAKAIISTIPIWNAIELHPQIAKKYGSHMIKKVDAGWSALTANFALRTSTPITMLYQQIHANDESLFFSFSHPEDSLRAPEQWQTCTVSTHIKTKYIPSERNEKYKDIKNIFRVKVEDIIKEYFPQTEEIKYMQIGTPLTFITYTKRFKGLVGGLPHSVNFSPLSWPNSTSGLNQVYLLGDTTFPGQGIVAVVQGSMNLYERLKKI